MEMSEKARRRLETGAAIFGAIVSTGLAGVVFTYATMPGRVAAIEQRATAIEAESRTNRELLIRIEERLISVQNSVRHNQ